MRITLETAAGIARSELKRLEKEIGTELELLDDETVNVSEGWIFFYNSSAYIRTGDISYALAGNGPMLIMNSRLVRHLPTHEPWQNFV